VSYKLGHPETLVPIVALPPLRLTTSPDENFGVSTSPSPCPSSSRNPNSLKKNLPAAKYLHSRFCRSSSVHPPAGIYLSSAMPGTGGGPASVRTRPVSRPRRTFFSLSARGPRQFSCPFFHSGHPGAVGNSYSCPGGRRHRAGRFSLSTGANRVPMVSLHPPWLARPSFLPTGHPSLQRGSFSPLKIHQVLKRNFRPFNSLLNPIFLPFHDSNKWGLRPPLEIFSPP